MRISPAWALAFGTLATVVLIAAVASGAREVFVLTVLVSLLTGAYLLRNRMRRRLLYDRGARRDGRP